MRMVTFDPVSLITLDNHSIRHLTTLCTPCQHRCFEGKVQFREIGAPSLFGYSHIHPTNMSSGTSE